MKYKCVGRGDQKLVLRAKVWSVLSTPTPDFEYSPTSVSKKFVIALEADHFHPFKRIANFVVLLVAKGNQELVSAELDVVTHHGRVHPNEFDGESINNKFHFDVDRAADDAGDACCRKAIDQFGVEEACKVAVESFVTADQFIAEAEARHESALFEPEYGAERA